jgi:hypothetical protein
MVSRITNRNLWLSIQSISNEKGNVELKGQQLYYGELLAIWKNVHEAKMRPKSNNFESYLSTVKVISRTIIMILQVLI